MKDIKKKIIKSLGYDDILQYPGSVDFLIDQTAKAVLEEVEKELKSYDYWCEDVDCCYGDVQAGIQDKIKKLREGSVK